MSGRFLLDTNIIVYSFDDREPEKQAVALSLIERAMKNDEGCISMQVVQESLSLLTYKFKHVMSATEIPHYLDTALEPLAKPLPLFPLYRHALSLQERWRFGFYDALIVAGALALDCDRLYSEDFQHGQRIEQVTVINPFMEA